MAGDERFRPREHLRLQTDFARVFARRCKQGDRALIIYVRRNELSWSRLGISTAKRIGNAVRRNYVRRRIREAFRRNKADLPSGLDIVCVARPPATDPNVDLEQSFRNLVRKAAVKLSPRP